MKALRWFGRRDLRYVDAPEPFDWWIEALASTEPESQERDRQRVHAMLREPPTGLETRDPWTPAGERRDRMGWEAHRALLWLGEQAPVLAGEQEEALGLGPRHLCVSPGRRPP